MRREERYLVGLLKAFLSGKAPEKWSGDDWARLTMLAQIHNVSGILGYMDMCHAICPEKDLRGQLRSQCLSTMGLYARRGEQAAALLAKLGENGIRHCPVKGFEVRNLYPVPELRTFSDVDLLILPEDRQRCHALMLSLGFEVKDDWEPVYSYLKGSEYYEIHTRLMEVDVSDRADYRGYFDRAWEHADPHSEFGYRFTPEFHLIYLLTHLAKHVQGSGAGIRLYLDIAVFVRQYADSMDWAYARRELEGISLWEFARTVLTAVEDWFEVSTPMDFARADPETIDRFLEFTMEAGVFGKHGREAGTAALKQEKGGSRLTVLLKRVFPSAESIETRYTYLQGRHWLLPAAWVHRWFKTDVSLKAHVQEAKTILTADGAAVERLQSICRDVGL